MKDEYKRYYNYNRFSPIHLLKMKDEYKRYYNYKRNGIKPNKFSWVIEAWNSMPFLTEKQFMLNHKCKTYIYITGLCFGILLGIVISGLAISIIGVI